MGIKQKISAEQRTDAPKLNALVMSNRSHDSFPAMNGSCLCRNREALVADGAEPIYG